MFQVRWIAPAMDELTEAWLSASTLRREITAATDEVDDSLGIAPYRMGESRSEGVRLLIADPLAAEFVVDETDRTVWVLHVWLIRRH